MAKELKGKLYIRLDANFHEHEKVVDLTPETAALRFIYMIAYSKRHSNDGTFPLKIFYKEGGSDEELEALLKAEVIEPGTDGRYSIVKYGEWQWTNAESEEQQVNGSKGGKATARYYKQPGQPQPSDSKADQLPGPLVSSLDFDVELSFDEAYEIYPKRPGDTRSKAFAAYVKKVTDIESRDEILSGVRGFAYAWSGWSEDVRAKVHYFSDFVTKDELWTKFKGSAPPLPPPPSFEPVELSIDIPVVAPDLS